MKQSIASTIAFTTVITAAITIAILLIMPSKTVLAETSGVEAILEEGTIEKGKTISLNHCTRCHVVGSFNPNGGISSTPSFQLLVNALKDFEKRFDTFYLRPPHPAVIAIKGRKKQDDLPYNAAPITITLKDVKHIAAFAKTLKNKK